MTEHWACLDLKYLWWYTEHRVVCTSDVPCHLTLYKTDQPPRKHPLTRVLRGLEIPWSVYFCFVSYIGHEQVESGDTLTHTFRIYDWPFLATRWFCITGDIGGVQSPSASPVFKHRRPYCLTCYHLSTSGYLMLTYGNYAAQHDSLFANSITSGYPTRYITGQWIPPNTLRVVRAAFWFDTTPLPLNCTLFDSRLVMFAIRNSATVFELVIVPGWYLHQPLSMTDFHQILVEPSPCASFDPKTFLGPDEVPLGTFGTQTIRRGAHTAFGVISSLDMQYQEPSGLEYAYIYRTTPGPSPYLQVAWYP